MHQFDTERTSRGLHNEGELEEHDFHVVLGVKETCLVHVQTCRDYDVYIGSYLGNIHKNILESPLEGSSGVKPSDRKKVYAGFFFHMYMNNSAFKQAILGCRRKTMGCFCSKKFCHGELILEFLSDHEQYGEKEALLRLQAYR